MFNNKTKFKIEINKSGKNNWEFGINISHYFDETYISINVLKWSIYIGKLYEWKYVETDSDF